MQPEPGTARGHYGLQETHHHQSCQRRQCGHLNSYLRPRTELASPGRIITVRTGQNIGDLPCTTCLNLTQGANGYEN